jgi:hypothetical protein
VKRDELIKKITEQIETIKLLTQHSHESRMKLLNEVRGWKSYFEE